MVLISSSINNNLKIWTSTSPNFLHLCDLQCHLVVPCFLHFSKWPDLGLKLQHSSQNITTASAALPQHQLKHKSSNGIVQHAMQAETSKPCNTRAHCKGGCQKVQHCSMFHVPLTSNNNSLSQGPRGLVVCWSSWTDDVDGNGGGGGSGGGGGDEDDWQW